MSPSAGPAQTLTPASIRAALGAAYDRYSDAEQTRHAEMLRGLESPSDVVIELEPLSERQRRITVAAADHVGLLASIAGLIAASGGDIVSCDAFTLARSSPGAGPAATDGADRSLPSRRPGSVRMRAGPGRARVPRARPSNPAASRPTGGVILDVFDVAPGADGDVAWDALPGLIEEVATLLADQRADEARERVLTLVAARPRVDARGDDGGQLYPVTIDLDNDSSEEWTQLTIRSADTRGFLFEFLSALVALDVSVARAEVRTVDGVVRDTFWVTDARGRKITDAPRLNELRVAAALI
jgi:UTP:GlnB (protein PII) uridylyltransferase